MKTYYNKPKKHNKIYLVIIIFIIVFLCLTYFLKNRKLIGVEKFIQDIYANIQNVFIIKKTSSNNDPFASEVLSLKEEIKQLKKELDVKNITYKKVSANVINRNVGYFYERIIIDKGSKHGLKENYAVTSNGGLIGIIDSVNNYSSTVKLISSANFPKISVKISVGDTFVYGLLSSYKNKEFIIEGISENVSILKDSLIMTTGLNDNIKNGIYIGKVKDVKTDQFDLIKTVYASNDYLIGSMNVVSVIVGD